MTRRLAAALGLFTIVVLAASVVPLGVATAERDRHDFERRTADVASAVAALLDDAHDSGTPPPSALRLEAEIGRAHV